MKTRTGMRRRGISLGVLSAEGTIAWFHPADAMAVALTAMGGTLLVTLIVMMAVILGNDQSCERVFRLLRWTANRPEPFTLGQETNSRKALGDAQLPDERRPSHVSERAPHGQSGHGGSL
jgi:hypothetical protein